MSLKLYNTKTRQIAPFTPLEAGHVRLYLCGPTVYNRAHIGNARSVVVFDVLRRLFETHYHYQVTYARNITDIDDKIITAAREQNISIKELTTKTTAYYHEDMDALGNLPPTLEPKATEHIQEMLDMIATLVRKGNAYVAQGHVLFDTRSDPSYGSLSKQPLEEMISGARVEVAPYKKNPTDFVLWKPSNDDQPGWESPYGRGRPGWHIECSAMCRKHLGETFDIHGGGQDLLFPHHENEMAQSTCAHGQNTFARTWLHNGMLIVDGKKMSKSLGNFYTVQDLLEQAPGEVIRFALLKTHYRQPLDWHKDTIAQSKAALDRLYQAVGEVALDPTGQQSDAPIHEEVLFALEEDLNTPLALSALFELAKRINSSHDPQEKERLQQTLKNSAALLGLLSQKASQWFQGAVQTISPEEIEQLINERLTAKKEKNYQRSDEIRGELLDLGIVLEDTASGTSWRKR